MKEIKEVEFAPGTDIENAVKEAIELAKREKCAVKFSFNGVPMKIYAYYDTAEEVSRFYKTMKSQR